MITTKENFELLKVIVRDFFEKEAEFSRDAAILDTQITHIGLTALAHLEQENPEEFKQWKGKNQISRESAEAQFAQILPELLFSLKTPWKSSSSIESQGTSTQKLLLKLLRGERVDLREVENKEGFLKAVVWKKDLEILNEARHLINTSFCEMFLEISSRKLTEVEAFHMEIVIGELLSLYPFLRPQEGESLQVPIRIEGEWKLIDYRINRLELTPRWLGSPLVAYGLTHPQAPSLLLFKGTNYPTDEGFSLSLLTDLNPFASVGSYAHYFGKEKIAAWLESQSQKVILFGKSLGGALSWRTAMEFPSKVAKVMAYGSPGFSQQGLADLDKIPDDQKPEFHFFCQTNDPVPFFDFEAHKGVNYYEILGSRHGRGLAAHADVYSTHKDSVVLKVKPTHMSQTWRRKGMRILRYAFTAAFPFLLIFHLLQTGVRNVGKLINKKVIRPLTMRRGEHAN